MIRSNGRRRARAAAWLITLVAFAVPAVAHASCPQQPTSTPFAPYGDGSSYFPIPNGSFANGTDGWRVGNGAWLTGDSGLALPTDSFGFAVSSRFCVSTYTPTARFFVRADGDPAGGTVKVVAWYFERGSRMRIAQRVVGWIEPTGPDWSPTGILSLDVQNVLDARGLTEADVRLSFLGLGGDPGAAIAIDEVYVDPYSCC